MATVRVRVNIDASSIADIPKLPEVQADMDRRAAAVLRTQQRLVPVDTGNLKRHLQIRNTPTGGRQIGAFDVDYAAKIEEGWQFHNRFIPGQPYIRPSIDSAR